MARKFTRVGVVGLGTMGAGIAEVFARNGLSVVAVDRDQACGRPRPGPHRALHRAGGGPRQAGRVRAGRTAGPDHLRHRDEVAGRRRPGDRGGARAAEPQARHLHRPGRDLRARDDPGHQHLLAVGHRDRGGDLASGQGDRRPLLQPGPGDEAGRGGAQRRHRSRRGRRHRGVRGLARQDRRHDRRPGRLHRQRAAVRLPQPRRRDVLRALRQPRGHRRRDEAGLRPADGSAGAAGPDRAGHRLRDPGHDVQAVARPAARPDPDLQADDRRPACWAARSAAASTPTTARTRRTWWPTPTPRRSSPTPSAARPVQRVGVVGSGTMADRRRRGVRQGRLRRALHRPLQREGRPGAQLAAALAGEGRAARQADRARSATRRWPGSPARPAWTTWRRWTWSSRRWSRSSRSSRRCSPTWTRSAGRARSWPPPPRRCR